MSTTDNEWTKSLAVRLDATTVKQVENFAIAAGLVSERGAPNISAALRVLVASALGQDLTGITAQVWQSARGSAMREVVGRVYEALKGYRDGE
jgi:predicted NAD-dependent protein-ADP-ribosyltransferase YbiA (DUF1768 family)